MHPSLLSGLVEPDRRVIALLGLAAAVVIHRVLGAEASLRWYDICSRAPFVEQSGNLCDFLFGSPLGLRAKLESQEDPHVFLPKVDVRSVDFVSLVDVPLLQ
tara:strand:- start:289 stop:594 length:306 start_codon:yes stop_codon:yes gene_type:complete